MKKIGHYLAVYLFATLSLASCGGEATVTENTPAAEAPPIPTVEDSSIVVVENGKGEKDTITYTCVGCKGVVRVPVLDEIARKSSTDTRNGLKYPLSFIPRKMELTIFPEDSLYYYESGEKIDSTYSVMVKYDYIAKNGYGNELEGDNLVMLYVKNHEITDLKNEMKLPPLSFGEEDINRTLLTVGNDDSYIQLIPMKNKKLAIQCSISCLDTGTWLVIKLENDEEVKLVSWNSFNCDGYAFYNWFSKKQIELLKTHKIKSLNIIDDKAILCPVAKNQADYLQQLVNL